MWVLLRDSDEWREPIAVYASKEKAEQEKKSRLSLDRWTGWSVEEVEFIE